MIDLPDIYRHYQLFGQISLSISIRIQNVVDIVLKSYVYNDSILGYE